MHSLQLYYFVTPLYFINFLRYMLSWEYYSSTFLYRYRILHLPCREFFSFSFTFNSFIFLKIISHIKITYKNLMQKWKNVKKSILKYKVKYKTILIQFNFNSKQSAIKIFSLIIYHFWFLFARLIGLIELGKFWQRNSWRNGG